MIKAITNLIELKEKNYDSIYECKLKIAELKKLKIIARAEAWTESNGTAKEKEDFVRSKVAHYDEQILQKEAEVEKLYNQCGILDYKIELEYLANE